ncbi:MFS transporter [Alicyclobacillus fodiniaquatilis]|jgi:MFS family permease|uniref:MFS transporter n=1 Tax=Alicyclobacillus fodiniaquatilis TaxID=1661150 RepID=A0ABW4JKT3_9BACL
MVPDDSWRKTLTILLLVTFVSNAGMSMIVPFLSLYVVQMGITNQSQAVLWSGMIFGANHLFISLSSPFWGKLADRLGPKTVMIPSGLAMGIVYAGMAFAASPIHLLMLRCVFGMVGGFGAASVALQAIVTPKERAGEALGKLQAAAVAGGLLGPLLGGVVAESIGMQHTFLVTSGSIIVSTLIVLFSVKRPSPVLVPKQSSSSTSFGAVLKNTPLIMALYFSSFLLSAGIQTIEPILTLYVENSMGIHRHVETVSGLIFSTSALGTVLAASYLGNLGDRVGAHRVLLICLLLTTLFYIPQAFVTNPYVFSILRFMTGISIGGLIPSINALLRRTTSKENQGMTFGLNQTAMSMGNVVGPLLGAVIDNQFGVQTIFYGTSSLFAINLIWIYVVSRMSVSKKFFDDSIAV